MPRKSSEFRGLPHLLILDEVMDIQCHMGGEVTETTSNGGANCLMLFWFYQSKTG